LFCWFWLLAINYEQHRPVQFLADISLIGFRVFPFRSTDSGDLNEIIESPASIYSPFLENRDFIS
jgi:hypothetical protein